MRGLPFLLQVGLLVAWYSVPAMATVPWYVIFLPVLIPAAVIGAFLAFGLLALIIAAAAAAFS